MPQPAQEQIISSELQEPSSIPPHRNLRWLTFFCILLLIVIITIPLLFYLSHKKAQPSSPKAETPLTKHSISIKNVLINHVPNFSKITFSDLPYIPQYGAYMQVIPYKNTLILAGGNKIIQIDAQSQKILKTLNTNVLDCVYGTALIGNNLYIFCQEYKGWSATKTKRGIYVLNLNRNEITTKYTDQKSFIGEYPAPSYDMQNKYLTLVNANFAVQGKTLWVGTDNRVIKIDTANNTIKTYTSSQLGFTGQCYSFGINASQKYVYVTAAGNGSLCPHGGISLYFPKTNTWKNYIETSFPTNNREDMSFSAIGYSHDKLYASYINGYQPNGDTIYTMTTYDPSSDSWKRLFDYYKDIDGFHQYTNTVLKDVYFPLIRTSSNIKDYQYRDPVTGTVTTYSLTLPSFIVLSNLVDNTYFLYATDGIYTLKDNSFPQLMVHTDYVGTGISPRMFVNKDKTFAVIMGADGGIGNAPDIPPIQLVDLTSGIITKLNSIERKEISSTDIQNSIFYEIPNGVEIQNKSSQEILATINFTTKSISFKK